MCGLTLNKYEKYLHSLEVVGHGSEAQLHVGETFNKLTLYIEPALARRLAFDGLPLFSWFLYNDSRSTFGQSQQAQGICMAFVQRRPNVFAVGPTLYRCWWVFCVCQDAGSYLTRKCTLSLAFCWFRVGPKLANLSQL